MAPPPRPSQSGHRRSRRSTRTTPFAGASTALILFVAESLSDTGPPTVQMSKESSYASRVMSLTKLTKGSMAVVLVGIVAAAMLSQHRLMREVRKENSSLRGQIERSARLASENEALSNRLAEANTTQSAANGPSQELLRLRGEVGVLRRQLQELEQRPKVQSSTGPEAPVVTAETLRRLQGLRIEREADYVSLKTLSDKLHEQASDPEGLVRALLASPLRDSLLSALLEQRQLAIQKLDMLQKDGDAQGAQIEDLSNRVADLRASIEKRSEGILAGLDVRVGAMKASLEALQSELDKATGKSR